MAYYYKADFEMVRGDDVTLTQRWDTNGTPVDISAWVFSFDANEISNRAVTAGSISLSAGDMTKHDSGSGTTDTISMHFTDTHTAVNEGRYRYAIKISVGTSEFTIAKGTLLISESEDD